MSNQKSIEKSFYSDGFNLAMQAVEAGLTQNALFSAIEKMHETIDEMIDSLTELARQNKQHVSCKIGCEWCCHQPVFAMDYELEFLKNFLTNNFPGNQLEIIYKRAHDKNGKFEKLEKEDLLNAKFPCPLLEDGVCCAYRARPMACRIYLSTNVKTCLTFYTNPGHKMNYPMLLNFPIRIGRMMNEGFKAGLKMGGIVAKEYRIEEKL